MIRSNPSKYGSGYKALLAGGVLAGALGLAISQTGSPYGSGPSGSGSTGDQTMPSQQDPATGQNPGTSGMTSSMTSAGMNTGWRIRVCSEKTKADNINFTLTSADKANTRGSPGQKSEGASSSMGTGSRSSASSGSATGSEYGAGSQTGPQASGTDTMGSLSQSEQSQTPGMESTTWSRGSSTEIPVTSPTLSEAQRLRIEAMPGEKDKKASICVLYNDHVAKKLDFDDREVSTVKQSDNGTCGC